MKNVLKNGKFCILSVKIIIWSPSSFG